MFKFMLTIFICAVLGANNESAQSTSSYHAGDDSSLASFETKLAPKFAWVQYPCENYMTSCCCSDGNSRVCSLPGVGFSCYFGGSFECDSSANCGPSQMDCSSCCRGPQCA